MREISDVSFLTFAPDVIPTSQRRLMEFISMFSLSKTFLIIYSSAAECDRRLDSLHNPVYKPHDEIDAYIVHLLEALASRPPSHLGALAHHRV